MLAEHLKQHNGNKMYRCHTCYKDFNEFNHLKKHQKIYNHT